MSEATLLRLPNGNWFRVHQSVEEAIRNVQHAARRGKFIQAEMVDGGNVYINPLQVVYLKPEGE